jgi:hypothetical protein
VAADVQIAGLLLATIETEGWSDLEPLMRSFGLSPHFLWEVCMGTHSLCSVPDSWSPLHWPLPISSTTAIIAAICGSLMRSFGTAACRFALHPYYNPRPLTSPPATQLNVQIGSSLYPVGSLRTLGAEASAFGSNGQQLRNSSHFFQSLSVMDS